MSGISVFENHSFIIVLLCSKDFSSKYNLQYRELTFVFRLFGDFIRKVLDAALEKSPLHIYRVFIDNLYGDVRRDLVFFDIIVLFADNSGITAIVSIF